MKIMQLEKDNQSLTHQLELTKLISSHELASKKSMADLELEKEMLKQQAEFQIKLAEKDKEIAAQQYEHKLKLNEKDQEIAAKENEIKLKLTPEIEIENANKQKLLELEKKMLANETNLNLKIDELETAINTVIFSVLDNL